jgi:hypothetical protein
VIAVVVSCHLPVVKWLHLFLWDEATVASDKCSVIYKLTSEAHMVKSDPRLNVSILVQSLIIPYLDVRGVLCIHLILISKWWTPHILGFKSPGIHTPTWLVNSYDILKGCSAFICQIKQSWKRSCQVLRMLVAL